MTSGDSVRVESIENVLARLVHISVAQHSRNSVLESCRALDTNPHSESQPDLHHLDTRIRELEQRKRRRETIEEALKAQIEVLMSMVAMNHLAVQGQLVMPQEDTAATMERIKFLLERLGEDHNVFMAQAKQARERVVFLHEKVQSCGEDDLSELDTRINLVETRLTAHREREELAPTFREHTEERRGRESELGWHRAHRPVLAAGHDSRPGSPSTKLHSQSFAEGSSKEGSSEGRRGSMSNVRRLSNSTGKRPPRRSVRQTEKQELSSLARKMAHNKEEPDSGEASKEGVGEEAEDVQPFFAPDEEGVLSNYLSEMFTNPAVKKEGRKSITESDLKKEPRREQQLQDKILPALKVIGLEFVLGDSKEKAFDKKGTSSSRRPDGPLAERVMVGNPIKVESLFTSYTLYTVTLEKRGGLRVVVHRRYTDFERLDAWLQRQHELNPNSQIEFLPPFPEKRILGKFKASFVEQRRSALEEYLTYIVKNQELSSFPFVRDWFSPNHQPSEF